MPLSIAEAGAGKGVLRKVLAMVLVLGLVALMTGLGFWQLDRATQKRALIEEQARRSSAEPVPFVWDRADYSDQRFRVVRVQGAWLHGHDFLLDNQVRDGRPGYQLITPWRSPESGRLLLVDRGWLPAPVRRSELPVLPPTGSDRELVGALYSPLGKAFSLGPVFEGEGWPRVVEHIDFAAISRALGQPVLPVILRLQQPRSGLVQQWPVSPVRPQRHVAYAIQWFVMASVLALLGTLLLTRKRNDHDD